MKFSLTMILCSHLSDVQELTQGNEEVRRRCNFVKSLLIKYRNEIKVEINPQEEFKEFLEKFPNNKSIERTDVVGLRVHYTHTGQKTFHRSKYAMSEGTIKRISRDGECWGILWDNAPNGKIYSAHKDYFEIINQ